MTKKNTRIISVIAVAFGGVLGYLYNLNYGCTEGCAISSSPILSTIYGGLMFGLFSNLILSLTHKKEIKWAKLKELS